MPALRERENDVLLLAQQFISEYNRKMNKTVAGLHPEVERLFLDYAWPGNVRELRNAIENAVLLARSELIGPGDLPACLLRRINAPEAGAAPPIAHRLAESVWRMKITDALLKTQGHRDQTAELLGISRTTLWRKMKALGLND